MSDENNNISIDGAVEQWVNLVLAHIEANKQKASAPIDKNKEEQG